MTPRAPLLLLLTLACNSEPASVEPAGDPSQPAPPDPSPPRIGLLDAGIDAVRIEHREAAPLRLEKRDGVWKIVVPAPERRASAATVEQLFTDLEGVEFVAPSTHGPENLYVHVIVNRADTVVLDARLGAKPRAPGESRAQLLGVEGSPHVWFVRRIPPWIYFAQPADFLQK